MNQSTNINDQQQELQRLLDQVAELTDKNRALTDMAQQFQKEIENNVAAINQIQSDINKQVSRMRNDQRKKAFSDKFLNIKAGVIAKIDAGKALFGRIKQEQIDKYQKYQQEQKNKEAEKLQKAEEAKRVAERKADMKAALREQDKQRLLDLKDNIVQKVTSTPSKVGNFAIRQITTVKEKTGNLDMKIKNAILRGEIEFERTKGQLIGMVDDAKAKGQDFTNDLLSQYRNYKKAREIRQAIKMQQKLDAQAERERIAREREAEKLQQAEEAKRVAERKADFEAALKEQRKQELLNMRNNAIQKVSSAKSKVGNFFTSKLNNMKAKGNAIKTNVSGFVNDRRDEFVNGVTGFVDNAQTKYNEFQDKRQIAREEAERVAREREAERLQQQEEARRVAERKADMKAALREQDKQRLLNFKDNVVQHVTSMPSKVGNFTIRQITTIKEKTGNLDMKFRNQMLRGEIEFDKAVQHLTEMYNDAKSKGQDFTNDLLSQYREFKENVKNRQADRAQQRLDAQEEKDRIAREKEAERLEQQEAARRVAEAKEAFKAALREQRKENLVNLRDGAIQKVSSAKSKVGEFARGAVNNTIAKGNEISERTKTALINLESTIKTKAGNVRDTVEGKVSEFQEMIAELEKEDGYDREVERQQLLEEYERLLQEQQSLGDNSLVEEPETVRLGM